mgnify:CR=1 FL=1
MKGANFLEKLLDNQPVEWKKLGEVAELKRGKTITQKEAQKGNFPVISGGQKPAYYINQFNREGRFELVVDSIYLFLIQLFRMTLIEKHLKPLYEKK